MYCKKCGKELIGAGVFCPACGAKRQGGLDNMTQSRDTTSQYDAIQEQIRQYRQNLIVLNGNKERGKLMFLVTTVVGGLIGIIMLLMGLWWLGIGVFAFIELVMGIPGFAVWKRAEGQILKINSAIYTPEGKP